MFKIPNYSGAGIYAILNLDNKSIYIGSSRNIKTRARSHRLAIMNECHPNIMLCNDSKKSKNFGFLILEKLNPTDNLLMTEYLYMLIFARKGYKLYNCDKLDDLRDRILCFLMFEKEDKLNEVFRRQFQTTIGTFKTRCTETLEKTFNAVCY